VEQPEAPEGILIRPYRKSDRQDVRQFAAHDEHERPQLSARYPGLGQYRADGLAHFYDLEPESLFVAEGDGEFIGNLLGTVDAAAADQREETYTLRLRRRRMLMGAYGLPLWLFCVIRSGRAPLLSDPPDVDPERFPAEFHIGVRKDWRRRGVGTALVDAFEAYLRRQGLPGYRIYASSYHHEGVSFYRKLGLEELGQFGRRFHDGVRWIDVQEHVFVRDLTT
jgi:GNAT superfamily N-acetyltransferase